MTKYLYLMRAENDLYKIGITNDVRKRFLAIYHHSPIEIALFHLIDIEWGAGELESYYHKRFDSARVKGEWFALTPHMIKEVQSHPNSVSLPNVWAGSAIRFGSNGQVYLDFQCPECKRQSRAKRLKSGQYVFNCRFCKFEGEVVMDGAINALHVEEY